MKPVTFIIILCLATAFSAVEARHLRQNEPQHYGFGDWWSASGKKHSPWIHSRKCYNPVTSDRSWTYYRLAVKLSFDVIETWSPSNFDKVSLTFGVDYGKVYDLQTNAEIGVWQTFRVTTTDEDPAPDKLALGLISSLVLELGPEGDDSITVTGATSLTNPLTGEFNDADSAVTGGIGKFLGASGEFVIKKFAAGPATVASSEAEINLWVPKLTKF